MAVTLPRLPLGNAIVWVRQALCRRERLPMTVKPAALLNSATTCGVEKLLLAARLKLSANRIQLVILERIRRRRQATPVWTSQRQILTLPEGIGCHGGALRLQGLHWSRVRVIDVAVALSH